MGIYTSSDGTQKDTATMNSFNLVNGLVKAVREASFAVGEDVAKANNNVDALKAEILTRLDTRLKTE
jgi:hypothetical protein